LSDRPEIHYNSGIMLYPPAAGNGKLGPDSGYARGDYSFEVLLINAF
jgi:hypothetical protein